MVIKVLNLDKCIKKFGDISKIDISPVIRDSAEAVKATAKKYAPINKDPNAPTRGNLKGSIRSQVLKRRGKDGSPWAVGRVYTPVEYAVYQEFGTYKMKAQPFLLPAMRVHKAGIQRATQRFIKTELLKISSK